MVLTTGHHCVTRRLKRHSQGIMDFLLKTCNRLTRTATKPKVVVMLPYHLWKPYPMKKQCKMNKDFIHQVIHLTHDKMVGFLKDRVMD